MIVKVLPEKYDYLAQDCSEIRVLSELEGGGLVRCTLPEGKTSHAVAHKTVEEIWFFLADRGQVCRKNDGYEQVIDVYPGVSLTIPLGTSFQFKNTGKEALCFIIVTIPRWPGGQEAREASGKW
jgi:mannose-6-phosphate isomerase-like protein (cupin superfamily)